MLVYKNNLKKKLQMTNGQKKGSLMTSSTDAEINIIEQKVWSKEVSISE